MKQILFVLLVLQLSVFAQSKQDVLFNALGKQGVTIEKEKKEKVDRIIQNVETADYEFISINKIDLKKIGSKFKVNINNESFKAEVTRISSYETSITYTAKIERNGYIIFTFDELGYTGIISLPNFTSYEFYSISQETSILAKIDKVKQDKDTIEGKDWLNEIISEERTMAVTQSDEPYLDVSISYTTAVRKWYLNVDAMINNAVALTQEIYDNSGVNVTIVRKPGLELSNFESGSLITDVDNFRNNSSVAWYRDVVKADICALIVKFSNDAYSGMAFTIRATSKENAYCVVRADRLYDNYWSLSHEIGHLQGLSHQYPSNDKGCENCDPEPRFDYDGHGYYVKNRFRTLMGTRCYNHDVPYLRIPRIANPLPQYNYTENDNLPAIPTGNYDQSNCAAVINRNRSITCNLNMRDGIPVNSQLQVNPSLLTHNSVISNYPNPFNPSTKISYNIFQDDYVKLEVFSSIGERIIILYEGFKTAGEYETIFDASALPSGIYYLRMMLGNNQYTRKILLQK